ncbi:MAG: recombinase RecT [Spirochaetaceae bacterium]|nr:recombinase RecT [Spirochaetaceae bacterium]MBR4158635.1 recombinase RecT [Spirochaetia bacterium]
MAVSNSLTTKANQKMGMTAYLTQDAVKNQINNVIGGKNGTRFITSIVSAVNANEQLQQCTNQSILSAALLGESLNLSPSPMLGYYYMVPFNDRNKGKVAQFQIGYKGLIQLAIRSGQYKKINVMSIKKGELEYFDPLNEEIKVKLMVDNWDAREKAETIGYYAMFELVNGFKKAIYWSKEQMEAHALQYSQGYRAKKGYTFWEKDFDAMAHKTLLRQILSKWGIMSTELQAAVEADEAVIEEDGSKTYVDNEEIIDVPETKPAPAEAPAKEETPAEDPAAALFGGN